MTNDKDEYNYKIQFYENIDADKIKRIFSRWPNFIKTPSRSFPKGATNNFVNYVGKWNIAVSINYAYHPEKNIVTLLSISADRELYENKTFNLNTIKEMINEIKSKYGSYVYTSEFYEQFNDLKKYMSDYDNNKPIIRNPKPEKQSMTDRLRSLIK